MKSDSIRKVVIAGGGTAGWMAAAAFSKLLGESLQITLVESEDIPTVGVGEATIPPMQLFHRLLGIDEQAFLRATRGTFKLGIDFIGWGGEEKHYFHSFGSTGKECWAGEFQHFWLHGLTKGISREFTDYSLESQAAKSNKFVKAKGLDLNYAYHFDAGLYANFLRQLSEERGVRRVAGTIDAVEQNRQSGNIEALRLTGGEKIEGDFFIDCTGFRGLLIEQTLHTGYQDWSHWLPCDRAVAMQTEAVGPAVPYTQSTAHEFGWQWRIPLQHRVGNGLVYCSHYASDEMAADRLKATVVGEPVNEPRVIKFRTGRRLKGWNKNCVALGLASGFIEPLESTSIHLVMTGINRLAQLFPYDGLNPAYAEEYNKQLSHELEDIRDFIILHYHVTQRSDSEFWRHCKSMDVPDSLRHRLELFEQSACVFKGDNELFRVDSWTQVMLGQGLVPKQYHPVAKQMPGEELKRFLIGLNRSIGVTVDKLPTHQEFIDHYCSV